MLLDSLLIASLGRERGKCWEWIQNLCQTVQFRLRLSWTPSLWDTASFQTGLFAMSQERSKPAWKEIMRDLMTHIKYFANIQFLSQINWMHKPLSHIGIIEDFLGHRSKQLNSFHSHKSGSCKWFSNFKEIILAGIDVLLLLEVLKKRKRS